MKLKQVIHMIDSQVYGQLQGAVERGRRTNGTTLSQQQVGLCIRAIIAYDFTHKVAGNRVGYISKRGSAYVLLDSKAETATRAIKLVPGEISCSSR